MTHVLHRHLRQRPPTAVAAQGLFITDAAGRRYIDASGGAAVSSLGHGHVDVMAAMHAQIDQLASPTPAFSRALWPKSWRAHPHRAHWHEPRLPGQRRL